MPILGKFIARYFKGCCVKRGSNDINGILEAIKKIPENVSVVIFPEGKIHEEVGMFKRGFAFFAKETGRDICCLGLSGGSEIMPGILFHPIRTGEINIVVDNKYFTYSDVNIDSVTLDKSTLYFKSRVERLVEEAKNHHPASKY